MAAEGAWVLASQISSVVGTLALIRINTEQLNISQFGELALALTVATLSTQVLIGGKIAAIGRFYAIADSRNDVGSYLNASLRLVQIATVQVSLMGIVGILALVLSGRGGWIGLLAVTLLFSIISGWNSAFTAIQTASRQRQDVAHYTILLVVARLIAVQATLMAFGASAIYVLIGYASSTLVVSLLQYRKIVGRNTQPNSALVGEQTDWHRDMQSYASPYLIWTFLIWAQQSSDRWSLQHFRSLADVGAYAALYQVGYSSMTMMTNMAITLYAPIIYAESSAKIGCQESERGMSLITQLLIFGVAATIVCSLIAAILHRELLGLIVAEEYMNNSHLLPYIILSGGIFGVSEVLLVKLQREFKTLVLRKLKVATGLFGICANIVGAKYYGLPGLVCASLAFAVANCLSLWLVTRETRGSCKWS